MNDKLSMTANKVFRPFLGSLFLYSVGTTSIAQVNLSESLHCTYQKGQILSPTGAENVTNSKPLKWTFNSLKSDDPIYIAGGDSGSVITVPIEAGTAIFLPYKTGTHTFTIWESGKSFWGKQSNIVGEPYMEPNAQQYIGTCLN